MKRPFLKNLCTPSYVYLVISTIFIIVSTFQNYGNTSVYCLGEYSCEVPSTFLVFFIKVLYVLFWTWVLNLMCNAGYSGVAWFLVLLPFVLMFVILGIILLS